MTPRPMDLVSLSFLTLRKKTLMIQRRFGLADSGRCWCLQLLRLLYSFDRRHTHHADVALDTFRDRLAK